MQGHKHQAGDSGGLHGFITLHLNDMAKGNEAAKKVKDEGDAGVRASAVDGVVVTFVDDTAQPPSSMDDFHLHLAKLAAKYLILKDGGQEYFAFEHHF